MPPERKYGSCGNAGKKNEFVLAPLISVDILLYCPRRGADGTD
jgi:hypothetical protein